MGGDRGGREKKKSRISFLSFSKGLVSSLMPAVIYFDSYLIEFCFMPTKKKVFVGSHKGIKNARRRRRKPGGTERKARREIKKKDETSEAAGIKVRKLRLVAPAADGPPAEGRSPGGRDATRPRR